MAAGPLQHAQAAPAEQVGSTGSSTRQQATNKQREAVSMGLHSIPQDHVPSRQCPPAKERAISERLSPSRRVPPKRLAFTTGGRRTYEAWCSLFPVAIPESDTIIQAANQLDALIAPWAATRHTTLAEVLKEIKEWMYATDRRGFYARGIRLGDVLRDFEGWQSAQARRQATSPSG